MKRYSITGAAIVLICWSCHDDKSFPASHSIPKVIEVIGYEVPPDSIVTPGVKIIDERRIIRIPVDRPPAIRTYKNVHPAGRPRVIPAGNPRLRTPGQDGFSLPTKVAAISHPFPAGIPEVVVAKDASSRDHNPMSFSFYSKAQGLKDQSVSSMLEDRQGNLWFGTAGGGVSKYDGKYFTHYSMKEGLSSNSVWGILEDRSGNLWFVTNGGGVTRYDGRSFTHYTVNEGLASNSLSCMLEDQAGNLWFGTFGGGVCMYEPKKDGSESSFICFSEQQGLSSNRVLSMLEDHSGNLWIGTFEGGVNKYDGKSFSQLGIEEGLSNNIVTAIAEDRSGNLWFGTLGGGINKYAPARAGKAATFDCFTQKEGLSGNLVRSMLEDRLGNLWVGTEGGGVSKYDGESFTHFTEQDGLSNNHILCILEARSGDMWFGTNSGGVSKYVGNFFSHFTQADGLSNNSVISMSEDKNGNLWFGTSSGGISAFDGSAFEHYTEKEGLSDNRVSCILEDRNGSLWFGGGGITQFEPGDKRRHGYFTHITEKDGLPSNSVWSMLEDQSGNFWIGSFGGGACKYQPSIEGRPATFTYYREKEGLSSNRVICMLEDHFGNLWFGTYGGGITKYQPPVDNLPGRFTHFTEKQGLPNNIIWSMAEDRSGNIWFGTWGSGVVRYEPSADEDQARFTTFTQKEGLSDDFVLSILQDRSGYMWFGTQFGLSKLLIKPGKKSSGSESGTDRDMRSIPDATDILFSNYTYADGFLGVGCHALHEDRNGAIWMGGDDRLTVFHQKALEGTMDTVPPNLQLASVQLFGEDIGWADFPEKKDSDYTLRNGVRIGDVDFDSVSSWYGVPVNLSLPYNNNYPAFNFIGITMNAPQKVKYQYMLGGMDQNWSALSQRTQAAYGNLPYGSYTFKVRAMSGEGYWSRELQYPFTIRPPWWYTWWAYGLYCVSFIGAAWMFYRYQRESVLRKERERTQKRELEQARQIVKAYDQLEEAHTHLKATQSQLIQSKKMASLGELTAGIAHEIQNPLNFVNNFSEVNSELLAEMNAEIEKGNFDEVKGIARSIAENEEKITNHGKRADSIVKGMLQHSRTSTGARELTDINILIEEYFRLAYHGLRARDKTFNATMKSEFDNALEPVNIVPQDIGRVILNLITNAFYAVSEKAKADPAEYKPTVTVSTHGIPSSPEGTLEVLIVVKDNGNGIPDSIKGKIFQPFFTTKPSGQGTGLGLSLSYDIVKAHHGELNVESRSGEGSEFSLRLPFV